MSQIDVQRAILAALEEGRAGVVATILRHRGSAPGKTEHKMLIHADGTAVGTVGGGVLEAEVKRRAADALERGEGSAFDLTVDEKGPDAVGGVCGGSVTVALELLPRVPRILVCGGGHCGREVALLLHRIGYLAEVHDDRPEMVTAERFPHVHARHAGEPEALLDAVGDLGRFSQVLLVSRGYVPDRAYGRVLVEAGYEGRVGMIGSRKKAKVVREQWLDEDGLPPAFVERVECPLGVSIGARSPAEIAVSIVASVIAWERGTGSGTPGS